MHVLFLTRYGELSASTRHRARQYFPYLREHGIECDVAPLLPDAYLRQTFGGVGRPGGRLWQAPGLAVWEARRLLSLLAGAAGYDAVYLYLEGFPWAPALVEDVLLRRNPRVVVDYDDAWYLTYQRHRRAAVRTLLGPKIPFLAARSRHVIAGNQGLADWARQYNRRVTVIPTCVDLARYPPERERHGRNRPVIGWIGTPITARYLRLVEKPLRALRLRHDFVLKVIGAPGIRFDGIDVEAVPWSEDSEVQEIRSCDIGIMPIADDEWSRGKSAFKLIQYMAAGVPAVASAIGANVDVVTNGEDGFLAGTPEEWVDRLAELLERPALRHQFAACGRLTVEQRFSLEVNAPVLAGVLRAVASS